MNWLNIALVGEGRKKKIHGAGRIGLRPTTALFARAPDALQATRA
jgi:hypothetical protein